MKGKIFNIQRFSVQDGPGIRTTVFMKGCPLNCLWCHNPESKRIQPVLACYTQRCSFCGACAESCPAGCHTVGDAVHNVNRQNCALCGTCTGVCPNAALEIIGQDVSVDDIMTEVLKDKAFYDNSGGGLTLSGGEPLYQPLFARTLLRRAKEEGVHTCVETSGFAAYESLEKLLPYTDLFLYDWKETDDALHKAFTGVSNQLIYDNLMRLGEAGGKIVLRCPIIPTHNDRPAHYAGIAALANRLPNLVEVDIMPYHVLGSGKCAAIGDIYSLPDLPALSQEEARGCADSIRSLTQTPVVIR